MKPRNVTSAIEVTHVSLPGVTPQEPVALCDIIVRPSGEAACLPGLGVNWSHHPASVDQVYSSICCLLEQASESFQHDEDLDQVQWGAVQQLAMARALFNSLRDATCLLQVIPTGPVAAGADA
ncbi:hypothetical protein [Rhodanobacter geophilus]|uniref:DUF3077 domain-containing protein n=1 Tax=Rhodanobacter geophilus TaxID=3162488 RepID=A0ABV3QS53_9GAMM